GAVHSMAFTPDGKTLLAYGIDGVRIWDTGTGKEVRHLTAERGSYLACASFSSDGTLIATAQVDREGFSRDGPIRLWDRATGKKVREFGNRHYHHLAFSPDGKTLAADSGFRPNHIELWEVDTGRLIHSWDTKDDPPSFLAVMPDGKSVITVGR